MKKSLLYISLTVMMAMFTLPSHAIDRKSLVNYAASLKGKKKAELKTAIYNACQPKKVLSYGSGSGSTWSGFYKTDRIEETNECVNRYSETKFYFKSSSSAISGMNIEHSFPKSWWGGSSSVNAYKDLFNLYPSESAANSYKSNYPMGKVTNPSILDDYEKVGTGPAGKNGNIKLCEPNDTWKGDFCRSYFYMATIYQNLTWSGTQGLQQLENNKWPTLQEWAYKLYLEWTRADKVLDVEVTRNNAIYAIQGNRNLFIDFPFLAEYVWGDSIDVEFDPNTSMTTAWDDDRYGKYEYSGGDTDPDEGEDPDTPDEGDDESDADIATVIFKETFDKCDGKGGNDDSWKASGTGDYSVATTEITKSDTYADMTGWTFTKGYVANKCVKVGSGSNLGYALSPEFLVKKGVPVKLTFKAGAWDGNSESTTLKLEFTGFEETSSSVTIEKGKWNTYTLTLVPIGTTAQIKWVGEKASNSRFFLDEICVTEYPSIDISAVGYATYFNSKYAYIMPEGMEGYVAYYNNGNWKFECAYSEDDVVPANEALVLKAKQGSYTLYPGSSDEDTRTSDGLNDLRGTDTNTVLEADEDNYFYALTLNAKSELSSVGFYWMNDTGAAFTNGAHKAYLKVYKGMFVGSVTNNVKGFAFNDACVTGIESVVTPSDDMPAYNLQGMRVCRDAKGFVIVGGKKYYNR